MQKWGRMMQNNAVVSKAVSWERCEYERKDDDESVCSNRWIVMWMRDADEVRG